MKSILKRITYNSLILTSLVSIGIQAQDSKKEVTISSPQLQEPPTSFLFKNKDEASDTLPQTFNKLFAIENILTGRIKPQTDVLWQNVLKATEAFVIKNDKSLLKYFTTLSQANNQILNSIKIIYAGFVAPAIIDRYKETGIMKPSPQFLNVDQLKLDPIKNELAKLQSLQKDIAGVQKSLNDKILLSPGARDTRKVLLVLAELLTSLIEKTGKDFQKLKEYKVNTSLSGFEKMMPEIK